MTPAMAVIPHRARRSVARAALLGGALLLTGCGARGPERSPPARQMFDGLPVGGSLADARNEGFTYCINFTTTMRCRRQGVMLMGQGPYSAAVDLAGGDGRGGFAQLILWHDTDQSAVLQVGTVLASQGWQSCRTGSERRGDQHIYMRAGSPVRISVDISYWGKRRLRVIPDWQPAKPLC